MRRPIKYGLALLLTGIMLMGNATSAFAATEEIGPGIGLEERQEAEAGTGGNTNVETHAPGETAKDTQTTDSGTQEIGPGVIGPGAAIPDTPSPETGTLPSETDTPAQETGDGTQAPETGADGESQNQAAIDELEQESAAAAAEAAAQAYSPMSVPKRQPHLQTTVMWKGGDWSVPYTNDQRITEDGKEFVSISIFLTEIIGNVHYRAYTSENGWTPWAMNGQQTNLSGNWPAIEAVQVRFSGPVHNDFDIYYNTSLSDGKETDWAKNGASAGTMNQGLTLKGFRMAFFAKGTEFPYSMSIPVVSAHPDGIQQIDGAMRYIHGDGSNFTGWAWNDLDRYYFADSHPVTGWQYIDGYKYYFAEDGKLVQDLEPIIGAKGSHLIRINKEMNTMTIYVKDGDGGFIIPLKTFLTSTGDDTPLGTFKSPEKYRWRLMNSGVYAQYATRLGSGMPFLMHSIIYDRPDTYTAWASTYNHLGVARSAGCIRLLSKDAKWVYDHCGIGTTIEVYNSPNPGPYDRPYIPSEIPFAQNWDPSDPNITTDGIAAATAAIMAAN